MKNTHENSFDNHDDNLSEVIGLIFCFKAEKKHQNVEYFREIC